MSVSDDRPKVAVGQLQRVLARPEMSDFPAPGAVLLMWVTA